MATARFVMLAMFVASGCSQAPPAQPTSISFATGPCSGPCPIYRVMVNTDGSGRFDGQRNTGVAGLRAFTVTPEQYRALVAQLEPIRPATGERRLDDPSVCPRWQPGSQTLEASWTSADGQTQRLRYNAGCDHGANEDMAMRLASVPDLLPIAELIYPR